MGSLVGPREGVIYGCLRTELPRLEVSRVKIGGISSPDLGKAQGLCMNCLILWEVQGFMCFSIQEWSFVQIFHLK